MRADSKSEEQKSYKKMFNNFKRLVESNIDKLNRVILVKHFISVVVEYLNFEAAVRSFNDYNFDKNDMIEVIYHNLANYINEKYVSTESNGKWRHIKEEDLKPVPVNKYPILLSVWSGEKVLKNLVKINEENIFDYSEFLYSRNIENSFILPIQIIINSNGNHSQFSARMKNKGTTTIKDEYDYSYLYSYVKFDGINFIDKRSKKIIEINTGTSERVRRQDKRYDELFFYSGVLFEMGRYLLE